MKLNTTTLLQVVLWAAAVLLAGVKDAPLPDSVKPAAIALAAAGSAALHRYAGKRDANGAILSK